MKACLSLLIQLVDIQYYAESMNLYIGTLFSVIFENCMPYI